jgi:hypothetical protein
VTDEWIENLKVEKVAGGQIDPNDPKLDIRLYAALLEKEKEDNCCRRKLFDQPDQEAPNLADPNADCLSTNTIAEK